jgi:hypothetical protein
MFALLDDFSMLHHIKAVRVADSRGSMGDRSTNPDQKLEQVNIYPKRDRLLSL